MTPNSATIKRDESRIHVVRERGGMGDWICISAALDGLAEKWPRRPITVWGPAKYRDLILQGHCDGMDRPNCAWQATDELTLRDRPDAPLRPQFDGTVIDLNGPCPAKAHERATAGKPFRSRIELFAEAAGVTAQRPVFSLNPDELTTATSQRQDLSRSIAIAPHAAAIVRSWPPSHCRMLAAHLEQAEIPVLWLDETEDYIRDLPGLKSWGLSWSELAITLIRCRCLISVDTGILHLAGALTVPALGLFGPTDARLAVNFYPLSAAIQGSRPPGLDCPCHYQNERGFGALACGAGEPGCGSMRSLKPAEVARALVVTLKNSRLPK